MDTVEHVGMVEHRHYQDSPYKVKLIRGQRGGYGWEISISGFDFQEILQSLERVDKSLKNMYGGQNGNEKRI